MHHGIGIFDNAFSGTLEVQDNGNLNIDYKYGNPLTSLWNGTELFHPDSNLIIADWDDADIILPNNTGINTNTFNGYTAAFGNLIFDFNGSLNANDDIDVLASGTTINLAHSNLIFRSNTASNSDIRISTTGTVTSEIGGDFIVENGYTGTQKINFKTSGTLNFIIKGDMELNAATTSVAAGSNPNSTVNIEGDLTITPSGVLQFNPTVSAGSSAIVNLNGDLSVAGSGLLQNSNSSSLGDFNFSGTGDGITNATTQTVDVASTSANENRYISFNVKNGAYVKQINRDFQLGRNSALIIETGAVYNFGFNGTTALNLTISGSQSGTDFSSQTGSTLIVTSPNGINTSGTLGNVQTVASNRSFNQTANFYYVGKQNQVTGNALTTGSSVKNVYAILDDNTLELRLTNRTGISDGGKLEIQQGIVIGEEAGVNDNDFYGPNGQLIMTGGEYRISTITSNQLTDYLPQLRKYSSYSLTGGIIHLNGTGTDNTQILSGVPNYLNLSFSGSNVLEGLPPLPPGLPTYKGISSAAGVSNNITISEDAIVDVKNLSLGGSGTNLIMEDQARFIMAGSGTKPDATGTYTFDPNTTIEFNNNGGFESIRLSNPVPDYANIVVSGSNVGTIADGSGTNSFIQFQANGSFMVTGNGTFKQSNTNGFSGLVNTSISNTNNPTITLLDASTVEYQGANQNITDFSPEYKNVTISGTGLKTLGNATDILVGEDLNMVASTLTINTNEALTVDEGIIVTGGDLNIEDSGSLIQINDTDTNSGSVTMKRNTNIRRLDYVYWSSPVEGFGINDVYAANTPLNRIYRWNPTITNPNGGQGNWVSAAGETMQRGVGYIVRGPESYTTTAANITSTFNNGKPFNGLFTINVSRGSDTTGEDDDWNLIGNPYPSAINALEFLSNTVNANYLDGFVNIWTHGNLPSNVEVDPFYDNFGSNYTANDYITHNGTGTTSGPSGFNGEIAAGQSFMVNMLNGGTATQQIEFRNNMRDKAYDNSQFYRNDQDEEKHRIWLDLVSENELTTRVLVGYVEGATQQRDRLYDAITDSQNFYSLIDNEKFVIQGRELPFNDSDAIPLGLNLSSQNNYTIGIAAIDGLFETENQTIYLKDNLIGLTYNLTENPYSFSSEAGELNDRFEIVFNDNSLTINENELNNALTIIEQQDGNVKFTTSNSLEIKNVKIYDVLGRLLYNLEGNSSTEIYNLDNLSQATYVAKVTLSNDVVITKKAIKRN